MPPATGQRWCTTDNKECDSAHLFFYNPSWVAEHQSRLCLRPCRFDNGNTHAWAWMTHGRMVSIVTKIVEAQANWLDVIAAKQRAAAGLPAVATAWLLLRSTIKLQNLLQNKRNNKKNRSVSNQKCNMKKWFDIIMMPRWGQMLNDRRSQPDDPPITTTW